MPDIDFQKIVLNLIPKREDDPVVFYASQYETTRLFIADLFWGDTEFAPGDDCWAEIDIRKNDDNLVVITEDVAIDNNEVSVILPVQAVTCIGKNLGQIKIYAGEDQFVAAFNFILEVQADPLAGGVTSETAIDNLTQQIEDIAEEVIGNDYYNKTETDALLADKANRSELSDLASKAELEYAINEEDTAIRNWAITNFATPGYIASNYYNKTQVDELLFNMLPINTALGNPCTFETEIEAVLQALTVEIIASGGGGTPSAPIPIVGHTELNLTRCGINIWDEQWESGVWSTTTGEKVSNGDYVRSKNKIPCKPLTDYYGLVPDNITIVFWDMNDNYLGIATRLMYATSHAFTTPANAYKMAFYTHTTVINNDASINYPATDTEYHAYNGTPYLVQFGQTVYGGLYDKSGRLTITHGYVEYDGSNDESWRIGTAGDYTRMMIAKTDAFDSASRSEVVCNIGQYASSGNDYGMTFLYNADIFYYPPAEITTIEDFRTWLSSNNLKIAYPLATPIEIDVQAVSPSAVEGTNTITSNCNGDVNVSYKDSIQHYIDTRG